MKKLKPTKTKSVKASKLKPTEPPRCKFGYWPESKGARVTTMNHSTDMSYPPYID